MLKLTNLIGFFLIFQSATSSLSLGLMDGYYTSAEVTTLLSSLQVNYLSISTGYSGIVLKGLVLESNKMDYAMRKILILGGFYGGYPMGSVEVLYIANKLAEEYEAGNATIISLMNSNSFTFIPVLNSEAYLKSELGFVTGENFAIFKTDLTGAAWGCNENDVGVNPYHNFPYNWGGFSDICSTDYSGTTPWSSSIAADLGNYEDYSFIINYQGTGEAYYFPYASETTLLDDQSSYFYSILSKTAPIGYTSGSLYNLTETSHSGTLLDTAFNKGIYSVEIAVGTDAKVPLADILSEAEVHYQSFIDSLLKMFSNITAKFLLSNETTCDSCDYYSTVDVTFYLINQNLNEIKFNLIADIEFNDTSLYEFQSTTQTTVLLFNNEYMMSTVENTKTGNSTFEVSGVLPAFSETNVIFKYHRLNETSSNEFVYIATVSPIVGASYFESVTLGGDGEVGEVEAEEDSSDGRSSKVGLILGLVIGLSAAIVIVVVACLCYRKKKSLENRA